MRGSQLYECTPSFIGRRYGTDSQLGKLAIFLVMTSPVGAWFGSEFAWYARIYIASMARLELSSVPARRELPVASRANGASLRFAPTIGSFACVTIVRLDDGA